jgi:hypothetical protein
MKNSRKFTLECEWESPDRSEEIIIGIQYIEIPKLKNVDAEIKQAIVAANRILMLCGGYDRGKITTIVIYDQPMENAYAIVSINQNEETFQQYHCELSEAMQTLMWFLVQVPKLKLSEEKQNG